MVVVEVVVVVIKVLTSTLLQSRDQYWSSCTFSKRLSTIQQATEDRTYTLNSTSPKMNKPKLVNV